MSRTLQQDEHKDHEEERSCEKGDYAKLRTGLPGPADSHTLIDGDSTIFQLTSWLSDTKQRKR